MTSAAHPTNQQVVLDALLAALNERQKAVSATPTTVYGHGPGGVFSAGGLNPTVVNATISPVNGLAARMPIQLSNYVQELRGILTGVTASTGTEPTTACGDAKQPGNLKLCKQAWPLGRIVMDSQVVQADRAGELLNRGEFLDYQLVGDPFAGPRQPVALTVRDALRSESKKKLFELMFAIHRDYGHLLFDGNPANTAGNTGYVEFNGLDRLINTGYRDATTGALCPAADSLVRNFTARIDTNATQAALIVTEITETVRHLRKLSEDTGTNPVQFAIAMRYSAFMRLTEIWPCAYMTYRCNAATGATQQLDPRGQDEMRIGMRQGSYLLVDDQRIEVIIDDFIPETAAAGVFTSDLYIVPLTYGGGRPGLYWEYFNLAGPMGMQEVVADMAPRGSFEILGGGRYWLHYKPPTNECLQIRVGYRPRVILETPFLAARINDIQYGATIHERTGFPSDTNYFVNGGSVSSPSPYLYPPLNA